MTSPIDRLIHSTLLPDHAHNQTHAAHHNDQRGHHLMHDQIPRAQERSVECARDEDAAGQEVVERVGTERSEVDDAIVDEVVDNDDHDGKIMHEETTLARRYPCVVKDENVSLDGRQRKESDLEGVDSVVHKDPDDVEDRRLDQR